TTAPYLPSRSRPANAHQAPNFADWSNSATASAHASLAASSSPQEHAPTPTNASTSSPSTNFGPPRQPGPKKRLRGQRDRARQAHVRSHRSYRKNGPLVASAESSPCLEEA